jgi:cyclopropane-fatty-acyl-phospholipid synthase
VVPGTHYARTLVAWLEALDSHAARARAVLAEVVGERHGARTLAQWRLFLLSAEQMWGWRDGQEWMVSHYLLGRR